MKPSQETLTSLHLPFDLVADILCRLSAKHLVRLRCVCKSWNSLISADSIFAKKHLRLSTSSQDRHHLILTPTPASPEFHVLHSPISPIFTSIFTTTTVQQFRYSITKLRIKGLFGHRPSTCDGLVCFKIDSSSALLCNPFIGKFKLLPPLTFPEPFYTLYTLVYDRFTNNYKIIAIYRTFGSKNGVSVHTVGTDYWRTIQDFPNYGLAPAPGIFVSDSVYWLLWDEDDVARFIVSLDLEKESYQNLSLPVKNVHITTSLGTLRGCLSLLSQRDKFYDVWIMKEYGNEKSWTKFLSVPHMKECEPSVYIRALYISKYDQVLMEFLNDGKINLVVYNFINNTFKIPKFQYSREHDMTPEVYVESLISPF
ncbi:unnamed protein product [Lathyrus sativus]|nr:unnamed protein product [Lathyrus sativus]